MNSKLLHALQSTVIAALVMCAAAHADEPSHDAFTYQGQLKHNGEAVAGPFDLKFRLYNAAVAGDQVGMELAADAFEDFDDEGRFTIDLEFGKAIFDGTALWLEIEVDETILTPRQPIMPTPYAIRALNVAAVADPALTGTYSNALDFTNPSNTFTGSGAGLTNLNASNLTTGTIGSSLLGGNYVNALNFSNASNTFAGDGFALTNLNAANITGVLPNAALSGTYSNSLNFSNATNTFAGVFTGSGAGLTFLNANALASGTVPSARVSGTYSNALTFSNAGNQFIGAFAGSGAGLTSLNASNISNGTLGISHAPTGGNWTLASTLNLASNTLVVNPTTNRIGIGTASPTSSLHVAASAGAAVRGVSVNDNAVRGEASGTNATAIFAWATSATGAHRALWARSDSADGFAGFFSGRGFFSNKLGIGTQDPSNMLSVVGDADLMGNLGIGTNSPEALLHVVEGTSGTGLILPGLRVFQNDESPNVIGGFSGNEVGADVVGATISGGGRAAFDQPNRVLADYGTVSGGRTNTASGEISTVGGGWDNKASGDTSTVGGGRFNNASGHLSTVSGGSDSTASGLLSTVSGGLTNTASGDHATVPGGIGNHAGGDYSFAAGRSARVRTATQAGNSAGDQGTFIWADSIGINFTSTADNQFLIRAGGGVGIGTNAPTAQLHV